MDNQTQLILLFGGLGLGAVLGILLQRSHFCMMAAISNWALMGDLRQFQAWLAAVGVAVAGTLGLESAGLIEIGASAYRGVQLDWLGIIAGGLIFGFGTTLAGGCAGRTLARVGEGNLGSLLVLISYTVTAMIALFGVLEPMRAWITQQTALAMPIADSSLASILGVSPYLLGAAFAALCGVLILATGRNTRDGRLLAAGAGIGLLVVMAWWVTGYLAQDELDPQPATSLSFSGPLARATLLLTTAQLSAGHFGVAVVGGVLVGSCLSAVVGRSFRLVLPDAAHVPHFLVGGALMGIGAIFAGGCNIGQGLSGVSTTALPSFVAIAAIFGGMRLGIVWLQRSPTPSG